MADILEIKKYPDAILRKKSGPVNEITPKEHKLFEDMLLTMEICGGIGLAAPQIGCSKQIIAVNIDKAIIKLANPVILKSKGTGKMAEGCLSVPEMNVEIKRPYEVTVGGLNEKGQYVEIKAKGLMARVLQHEIDHLNGKLILDYTHLLKKILYGRKKAPVKK
ncbi:MAG: peptide deformylase [Candidatus Omnitrophica bacterium]|nr:peptide deformylase [Candidatus Omnitrophota bacterium]